MNEAWPSNCNPISPRTKTPIHVTFLSPMPYYYLLYWNAPTCAFSFTFSMLNFLDNFMEWLQAYPSILVFFFSFSIFSLTLIFSIKKTCVKGQNIHIPSNITLHFSWKWAVTSIGYWAQAVPIKKKQKPNSPKSIRSKKKSPDFKIKRKTQIIIIIIQLI